ncbi:DUF1622 domain-containing protein [Qipengyuania marisflavi]|uniref:DUF1622 domain-containing protein n=1 Tax=Qipengyuania marisflavi TaxID=2486356 RepID=A0A5S3P640_9SPHN|nr:DUF1622 domain-containing protein [Qipengyuania marisflavi]TMM48693.1 DUF1622 domain-containing protein [Qipengyuania marisflavi]
MLENLIREITLAISLVVEGVAAVIVAYAVIEAVLRLVGGFWHHSVADSEARAHNAKEEIRLRLGRWLALALELLLGADILRTAVAPSWSEIGQLAAIATIRTALNYFLQKEIDAKDRGDQVRDSTKIRDYRPETREAGN